jgi:hypothetical protein
MRRKIMTILGRLIEFGIVLAIAGIIGGFLYYSVTNSVYPTEMKTIIPWGGFFIIPLIYYRLIRFNINAGRR